MRLPEIPYNISSTEAQTVAFRGINYSDMITDGDLADSKNISARRYPYITTRRAREKIGENCKAIYAHGKLITVVDKGEQNELEFGDIYGGYINGDNIINDDTNNFYVTYVQCEPNSTYEIEKTDGRTLVAGWFNSDGFVYHTRDINGVVSDSNGKSVVIKTGAKVDGQNQYICVWFYNKYIDDFNNFDNYSSVVVPIFNTLQIRKPQYVITYDGEEIAPVNEKPKQIANVNTKIVVFPDKKIIDTADGITVNQMDAKYSVYSATGQFGSSTTVLFGANSISVNNISSTRVYNDFTKSGFNVGDKIKITAASTTQSNIGKIFTVESISASEIVAKEENVFDSTADGHSEGVVTLERIIPDMDYICESENRLWGCSSEKQTIYASALGDPMHFDQFDGNSTDSYSVAVGTSEKFTGCTKLASSVLFFKENYLHKIIGSYPAEYMLYSYNIEGLQDGGYKSMQVINETLFYRGNHGVYAYSGGSPTLISSAFGDRRFYDAVSGNDGDSYYLSVLDEKNEPHLLVYETKQGMWVKEDNIRCVDFARIGKDMYFLTDKGDVFLADNNKNDNNIEWFAQFAPMYETISGKKIYSKLTLRLDVPVGSYVTASVRKDSGAWQNIGRVIGKGGLASMRIPISRCDKFELRLSGKGVCTVMGIMREYSVGSEV